MSEPDETNSEPVVQAAEPVQEQALPADPPAPIVVLHAVSARDESAPRRRARGALHGVSVSLGAGVFAFVGAPEDGTIALFEAVSGTRAPLNGRVKVAGADPARSTRARARIGMLAPDPQLPPARTVDEAVSFALRARGQTSMSTNEVLASLGVDHLRSRDPRSLSFAETRAVDLALALSTPSPLLVVLHDPLVDVAINLLGVVRERIRQLAQDGACVVVTTSSPADARALGDRVFVLHRGLVLSESDATAPILGGTPQIIAWVRPAEQSDDIAPVRLLAQRLAGSSDVSSVAWSDGQDDSSRASELRLSGDDLDACALALVDAAAETGVIIEAIAPASPGLTRLRAAAETVEALRRAATAQPNRGGR